MMAEKKNVPVLRFPEFGEDWFEQQLEDIFTFKNGINASKEDYGSGYKFINVLDIIQNDFITHDDIIGSVNVSPESFQKSIVEYGDIVFQRSSETREEVGQANVYLDERPATFGGFVIRGKKKADYSPYFINQMLKTDHARKEMVAKSGGSTRYNIGQETLKAVTVFNTILPEQEKISTFLAAVDERLSILKTQREELLRYKKGVMQRIFDRELRFRDDEARAFPEWEERKMDEILTFGSGRDYKHLNDGDIPVYGTGGLMTSVDEYIYEGESVGIGRKGTIDKPVFLDGKFWTVDTLFYTHSFVNVLPYFVYAIFQMINWRRYNEASGVPSLSKSTLNRIKVLLPEVDEQRLIVDSIKAIEKRIKKVSEKIEETRNWKQGLLQNLFV
jgi:type I restriction enzyme S subunit